MKMRGAIFLFCLLMTSCVSSHRGQQTALTGPEHFARYTNLADALRGYPGLIVSGAGEYAKVQVRSHTSTVQSEPLYVLDGFPVGNHYVRANQMVDMAQVKSVQVLRRATELTTYGDQGAGGVILINTK